jgi:hypothetical protein
MDLQALLDFLAQQQGQQKSKPKSGFSGFLSKSTLPLLLGGSLSSIRDTPGMRGISSGLNALALLSMLGQQ